MELENMFTAKLSFLEINPFKEGGRLPKGEWRDHVAEVQSFSRLRFLSFAVGILTSGWDGSGFLWRALQAC